MNTHDVYFSPDLPQISQLCFKLFPVFAGGPQLFPVKEADGKRRKDLEKRAADISRTEDIPTV